MKGLIVSNMTADFHKYAAYNNKLREELRPSLVDTLKAFEDKGLYTDPLYLSLVEKEFYAKHICRIYPFPEPVARSFKHFNMEVYAYMQGPSEFVPGGILKDWTVWDRLKELRVPTLTVGAKYDSMNPEEMKEMAALGAERPVSRVLPQWQPHGAMGRPAGVYERGGRVHSWRGEGRQIGTVRSVIGSPPAPRHSESETYRR
jgi:proline-specific peptidase